MSLSAVELQAKLTKWMEITKAIAFLYDRNSAKAVEYNSIVDSQRTLQRQLMRNLAPPEKQNLYNKIIQLTRDAIERDFGSDDLQEKEELVAAAGVAPRSPARRRTVEVTLHGY